MNVSEVLNELGIPFVEGGSHKSVRANFLGIETCPFCGHGGYYAAFPRDGGPLSCWACGSHRFTESLSRLSGKSHRDVFDLIGVDFETMTRRSPITGAYSPPLSNYLERAHIEYLHSRGIDVKCAIDVWKISGFGHLAGNYIWSLFLPVFYEGRAVSWTTRKIGKDPTVRYRTSPPDRELIPIKSLLYGHDLVRGTAVVTEGPMDALRIGPGAVSTFGAQFSPKQVAKLAKIPRRVICFDSAGDVTGERMGQRLADALAPHDGETILVELDAKDAAEASDREIRRLRRLYLD